VSEFWKLPEFRQHYRSPLALQLLENLRIGTLHPDDIIPDYGEKAFAKRE
jgi:hypothetical protein